MERVMVYVDGFNLYYGLRASGWRRYYWLDLRRLSDNLLRPDQKLVAVRYFTAAVRPDLGSMGKARRQKTYLKALETLSNLSVHYGKFFIKDRSCRYCGATWKTYEEKMTDVNIAVELFGDAQDDKFDTAIIISGDGDLASPIRAVRERYPAKRAVVAFPPRRNSFELRSVASASFTIGRKKFHESQLPDQVTGSGGYKMTRPQRWA